MNGASCTPHSVPFASNQSGRSHNFPTCANCRPILTSSTSVRRSRSCSVLTHTYCILIHPIANYPTQLTLTLPCSALPHPLRLESPNLTNRNHISNYPNPILYLLSASFYEVPDRFSDPVPTCPPQILLAQARFNLSRPCFTLCNPLTNCLNTAQHAPACFDLRKPIPSFIFPFQHTPPHRYS